jgi:hypothetical protein
MRYPWALNAEKWGHYLLRFLLSSPLVTFLLEGAILGSYNYFTCGLNSPNKYDLRLFLRFFLADIYGEQYCG